MVDGLVTPISDHQVMAIMGYMMAVLSESAIFDNVTPPELPKPATCPLCLLSTCVPPHPCPSRPPGSPPLSSTDLGFPSNSQAALLATHQVPTAKDLCIAHVASANVNTQKDHWSCSACLMLPLDNHPLV